MGFIQNIRIRTKLASLVAVNVLLLGLVALYSVGQIRSVKREIHAIAEHDIPLTRALTGIAQDQEEVDLALERVLRVSGVGAAANPHSPTADAARAALARLEKREEDDLRAAQETVRRMLADAPTNAERVEFTRVLESLARIEREFTDYERHVADLLTLIDQDRRDEAEAALPAVMREEAELDREVHALSAEMQDFTAAAALHAEAHEQEVLAHVGLAGGAGVAVGLALGVLYALSITRPLGTAVGVADRLAAGDRHFPVPAGGREETGALLRALGGMATQVARYEDELKAAHARSERLLLNVLPAAIADRLKADHRPIADGFAEATILFADVVGFTALSARVPPADLVQMLNRIFSAFDHLAERHGLEKIKTIGDCYMAVGGLPVPRADHARAVAEMALDMQAALAAFDTGGGERLSIRIGINSGPVVAGVIGIKKFIYDLWGDTVNVASRMESHGVAGEVQVSESTYRLLPPDRFAFEDRGMIQVKGRGEMQAYLLKGRLPRTGAADDYDATQSRGAPAQAAGRN